MAGKKCVKDCVCDRHFRPKESFRSGSTKCPEGCSCGRHRKVLTKEQKANIGSANRARRGEKRPCPSGCSCGRHRGYHYGGSRSGRKYSEEALQKFSEAARERALRKNPHPYPLHLNSDKTKGYIYVIGFSTGRVKVGRSTSPRQRVGHQVTAAKGIGVEVENIWLSVYHLGYAENEATILNALNSPKSEYVNTSYDEVIKIAESVVDKNANDYSF